MAEPYLPNYRTVSISDLTPGNVLTTPVFDQNWKKLLHSGTKIDEHLLERLRQRGIKEVQVDSTAPKEGSGSLPAERCGGCGSAIHLNPPKPHLKASIWFCNSCRLIYFASDEQADDLCGLTRADSNTNNPFSIAAATQSVPTIPSEYAQRLARLLIREDIEWGDRRQHKRYSISVPVVVLRLGSHFQVIGEAMQLTTANVSLGGAALLHTRFLDDPYLAIDFTLTGLEGLRVVFQVLRRRNLGPVYEIGGQFISRVS